MKKWTNAEVIELDVADTSCHYFWWPCWVPCKPKKPVVTTTTTTPDEPPVTEEPPVVDLNS
jgi:hypothetical protein